MGRVPSVEGRVDGGKETLEENDHSPHSLRFARCVLLTGSGAATEEGHANWCSKSIQCQFYVNAARSIPAGFARFRVCGGTKHSHRLPLRRGQTRSATWACR